MPEKQFNIAVVGATGAVGNQMIRCLEERQFPVKSIKLLASFRSAGRKIRFKGNDIEVHELTEKVFKGFDIALFSAGGGTSKKFAPFAAKDGCIVVDNSSVWRMDPDVPLVVPEVNPHTISEHTKKGIIANPNCSTIQMVVPLHAIYQTSGIKRVVVSTYQAVSGTGKRAIDELLDQTRAMLNFSETQNQIYPHRIAFNCLPHIDVFLDNGYTKEEMKMVHETRKILGDPNMAVTATTVRVPVFYSHSEAVNVETLKPITAEAVKSLLKETPGVEVVDDPDKNAYPLAIHAAGRDQILVGRIRNDESIPNGINMWVVADNIRKGAATNAVQIAEVLATDFL